MCENCTSRKASNNELAKDKYQIRNLEHSVEMVIELLDNQNGAAAWYTSLDMRYACDSTIRHRNSKTATRREAKELFSFVTGVHG